ncbi:MAG: HAMP domain-containing histidine kinase [Chthonomonas sp.]|nr:HAMP domain-containing histidine kinase [Chthonomonas sp.]
MKSLSSRFMLLNGGFVLVILVIFGFVQHQASVRTIEGMVDHDLLGRAQQLARNASRPPDEPFGMGGPIERRPPNPPPNEQPLTRPRIFNVDGKARDPESGHISWSQKLFSESLKGRVILETHWVEGQEYRVVSAPIPGLDRASGVVQVAQHMGPYRLAQHAQLWVLAVAIPLGLIVAGLLGFILAKLVLNPVRTLTFAAERIAQDPSRKEEIAVAQNDEIGRLAGAFNAMTKRLQQSNRELAVSLDQQKQFTSDAAHEFRTPLTGIVLAAENGLHDEATSDDMKSALKMIHRNGEAMANLTQLLLTLARLDHSKSKLDLAEVSILPVIDNALEGCAKDSRIEIAANQNQTLYCNADAAKQMVRNLVENALAYTPEDGKVSISVEGRELIVSDTGSGIAPEHLPHLFDRFYRADPSRHRAGGGTGLGLAIVKELADRQGATVSVASTVGVGTRFTILFEENRENSQVPHV